MFFTLRRLASLSKQIYSSTHQISFDDFQNYMDHPHVKNRVGAAVFYTLYFFAKAFIIIKNPDLLTQQDKLRYKRDKYAKNSDLSTCAQEMDKNIHFYHFTRVLPKSVASYYSLVPYTSAYNDRKSISDPIDHEVDQAEQFFEQFQNDLEAMKKPRIIANTMIATSFDNLLKPSLLKSITHLVDTLSKLKNHKKRPVYYLDNPNIQNRTGYQAFLTLYDIAMHKKDLEYNTKPSLADPLKAIKTNDIARIFPPDSIYRAYLKSTRTWWGTIKSYIPFTKAYDLKIQISVEIEQAKEFIDSVEEDIGNNSISELARRYPFESFSSDAHIMLATAKAVNILRSSSNPSPRSAGNTVVSVEQESDKAQQLIQHLSAPPTPSSSRIVSLSVKSPRRDPTSEDEGKRSLSIHPQNLNDDDGTETEYYESEHGQSDEQLNDDKLHLINRVTV